MDAPVLKTPLPGPKAAALIGLDRAYGLERLLVGRGTHGR